MLGRGSCRIEQFSWGVTCWDASGFFRVYVVLGGWGCFVRGGGFSEQGCPWCARWSRVFVAEGRSTGSTIVRGGFGL
eukprot:14295121-Ditylum_brightwellii.AAC.1